MLQSRCEPLIALTPCKAADCPDAADRTPPIAKSCAGAYLHDLRHAYTTWLVDDGVPVNMAQRVMLTIDSDHSHEDQFRTFD